MTKVIRFLLPIACALAFSPSLFAEDALAFHAWAARPTLGWNSWDFYGTSINEERTKAQADYMAANLLPHGWNLVTVDIQWYQPTATGFTYINGAALAMDSNGRLQPATNRFPSASGGPGFKPLADYVHSKGLRFGIHMMRGIPRQAVTQKTPVLGTPYTADQIADTTSVCPWNSDMYGVDMTKPGAQAYYDSLLAMVASWGVDFVKIDDLSASYHTAEIEGLRKAIDKSGRPIVFSTSPGETPVGMGAHIIQQANQWRIRDDFWDNWDALKDQFRLLHDWESFRGPGYFPDADMLPLGKLSGGSNTATGRVTYFTIDEQYTMMSLWAIARSPLIHGGDMTQMDAATLALLTNDEVLAVNQRSVHNRQLFWANDLIAWTADAEDSGDKYLAVFNATGASVTVPVTLSAMGFTGACSVRALWDHADLGTVTGTFSPVLASHRGALYRVSGASNPVPWITGIVPGNNRVALSWEAVGGATTYLVKRATSEMGTYATVASGVTGPRYTDLTAQNGTRYFYAVSAMLGGQETVNSGARSALPVAAQGIVGWNYDRYGTVSGPACVAGAVPAAYWNNSYPTNKVSNLADNRGGETTLDIATNSYNVYSIQASHPGVDANGTYNRELLNGYLNSGSSQTPAASSIAISQIPFASYDLYVYFSADTANRPGTVTDGATTFSFKTLGSASISGSNAVLTQTTDTASGNPAANYAVFAGLTGSAKTVTCNIPAFGGIAGFELVPRISPLTVASPASLANGVIGSAYTQTLTGSGGSAPYSWSLSAGILPPGLSLGSNGAVTGIPSSEGTFTFTVQIADSAASTTAKEFTVSVLSQFNGWRTSYFTTSELADSSVSGPQADPDGDGISNLLEFATAHNPKAADSTVMTTATEINANDGNRYLTGTFTRRKSAAGITYHIEASNDLATWSEGVNYVTEAQVTDDGNGVTETVKVRAANPTSAAAKQFLRLRVTQP